MGKFQRANERPKPEPEVLSLRQEQGLPTKKLFLEPGFKKGEVQKRQEILTLSLQMFIHQNDFSLSKTQVLAVDGRSKRFWTMWEDLRQIHGWYSQ